jgi:chromosome segregation ATPase
MQKSAKKKEDEKAEAENSLAEATVNFDETDEQMQADVKFYDGMKKACEAKSEEWDERKKLRDEELQGIKKAIDFLSSDEARELFHRSIKPGIQSFIQLSSVGTDFAPERKEAYQILRAKAVQTQSLRLATLAARVRTATGGHFDEVMKAIDDMVQLLKDEAKSDAEKRDQCKEEFTKIESKVADLDWRIEKNEAKIAKLEALITKREEEKAKTVEQIKEVKEQIGDMEDTRNEENAAFKQAKEDDEKAIELLTKAKDVLAEYYGNNDIDVGASLAQKDGPEFAEDPDVAPDATFSDKGSRKTPAKGIVSIIAMIIEDLNGEVK